jgi:curved DNA-binding protein CbpA
MGLLHTHYDNLKISRSAPSSVIKAAYKALAQENHPDRCKDSNAVRRMQIINDAYAVLSNPEKRAEHDKWISKNEKLPAKSAAPKLVDPRTNMVVNGEYVEKLHRLYRERHHATEKNLRGQLNFKKWFYIFVGLLISVPAYVIFSDVGSAIQKANAQQNKEAPMMRN